MKYIFFDPACLLLGCYFTKKKKKLHRNKVTYVQITLESIVLKSKYCERVWNRRLGNTTVNKGSVLGGLHGSLGKQAFLLGLVFNCPPIAIIFHSREGFSEALLSSTLVYTTGFNISWKGLGNILCVVVVVVVCFSAFLFLAVVCRGLMWFLSSQGLNPGCNSESAES